jgi:hypothetical protein
LGEQLVLLMASRQVLLVACNCHTDRTTVSSHFHPRAHEMSEGLLLVSEAAHPCYLQALERRQVGVENPKDSATCQVIDLGSVECHRQMQAGLLTQTNLQLLVFACYTDLPNQNSRRQTLHYPYPNLHREYHQKLKDYPK